MTEALIIIGIVLVLIIIFLIAGYNSLVRGKNNIEEGYATMDVYLKKRFDLVPNLVETVKGYAKHESETLEKVIRSRQGVLSSTNVEEKLQHESELGTTLRSLFALGESYPDLKANENFVNLQNQLRGIEDDIANARKYYNAVVKEQNNRVETFPKNIVASMFHFTKQPMFETDAAERSNVKVTF